MGADEMPSCAGRGQAKDRGIADQERDGGGRPAEEKHLASDVLPGLQRSAADMGVSWEGSCQPMRVLHGPQPVGGPTRLWEGREAQRQRAERLGSPVVHSFPGPPRLSGSPLLEPGAAAPSRRGSLSRCSEASQRPPSPSANAPIPRRARGRRLLPPPFPDRAASPSHERVQAVRFPIAKALGPSGRLVVWY